MLVCFDVLKFKYLMLISNKLNLKVFVDFAANKVRNIGENQTVLVTGMLERLNIHFGCFH